MSITPKLDKATHIPLHIHTEYSLLDGASRIEDICAKAKANGIPGLAITDHGTMFGAYRFYTEAKNHDLKPIIGCEVYIINGDHTLKGKENRLKLYHLVLLAKNDNGYKNLIKIVSESCINGFYYKPRISKDFLRQYSDGLVALSACLGGEVNNLLVNNQYQDAIKAAKEYQDIFGEDFYLEIMDHCYPEDRIVNPGIIKIANQLGIKVVATNDSHYTNAEDANAHDALLCLQTQRFISEIDRMKFSSHEYLKTGEEMAALFKDHLSQEDIQAAVFDNPTEIYNKIEDYQIFANPGTHLPTPQIPSGISIEDYLKELAYEGTRKHYGEITEAIKHRLDHELMVMNDSGFAAYFIVVWDFIKWARENNIPVGPGRGSAAGSLVAYALGITNIDPLKYNLLFERFLNPERKSMPDIDTDFCIARREEVINYVREKYGLDNVCQIITFNRLTSRAVIKDMARVLEYPYSKSEELAKMIPVVRGKPRSISWMIENHSDFAKKYKTDLEAKEVIDLALKNEGLSKNFGVHAAGVIISDQPVNELIPISKSNDGNIITQFAMDECAYMGLLKMDFLGLRNLTMIKTALELIWEVKQVEINIDNIDLEDSATYDTICSGNLAGIFQLETSSGMKQIARDLAPRNLEDISALIALYRPGPLDTGMIDDFINRKSGKSSISYEHPLLAKILGNTYGTIVYQEQIMQIAQVLAGFSLGEADLLRRAMGKKKPEVLLPFKDKFTEGCKANPEGIPADLAEKLFEQMLSFAEYCFNKSHSTAYGFITYQTAYLKTHYPVEYLAALLRSCDGDTDRIKIYIVEAERLGIQIIPPNVNLSDQDFSVVNNSIVFGLRAIKGVGDIPCDAIIEERNANGDYKDFNDFCSRLDHKKVNKKTLESLIKSGALDSLGMKRKVMIENLESLVSKSKRNQEERSKGQENLFAALNSDFQPSFQTISGDEYSERELQAMEYELLGLFTKDHPMLAIKTLTELLADTALKDLEDKKDGAKISAAVLITDFTKKLTKSKRNICILNIEDMEARTEAVLFSKELEQNEHLIQKGKRVLIKGTLSKHSEGNHSLMVESLVDLDSMGVLSFRVNMDQVQDYFQFFHSLKNFISRSENQGSHIVALELVYGNSVRKISLGSRYGINDLDYCRNGLQSLIDKASQGSQVLSS